MWIYFKNYGRIAAKITGVRILASSKEIKKADLDSTEFPTTIGLILFPEQEARPYTVKFKSKEESYIVLLLNIHMLLTRGLGLA